MTPILTAPSEVLARASEDPNSQEAKFVKNLMTSLGNWHSGDTAYMMLPSDIAEGSTTQKMFDIKLIGIDGGTGKQFDTSQLIEERQKAILNAFGASFSVLGQSGNGSYALADTQKGTHAFYIEKDINFILEVFNRELIPQLLALNGIYLEDKDMPKLLSGTVDEADSDLVSKAIQRISAVGQLPVHPELMNEFLTELGYTYRVPSDVVSNPEKWEEYKANYMPKSTSRSGDGMASGTGNGTSQEVATDDADAGNLDS